QHALATGPRANRHLRGQGSKLRGWSHAANPAMKMEMNMYCRSRRLFINGATLTNPTAYKCQAKKSHSIEWLF
ncbi:MAG: hypothetical protein RR939_12330, partial [Acinetobacter sp.]